jgi:hypothetical protein
MTGRLFAAILTLLGLWSQAAQADTYQLPDNGTVYIIGAIPTPSIWAQISDEVSITNLPSGSYPQTDYGYGVRANFSTNAGFLSDFANLFDAGSNIPGPPCGVPCPPLPSILIPGGMGAIALSVSSSGSVSCYTNAESPFPVPCDPAPTLTYALLIDLPEGVFVSDTPTETPLPAALPLFAFGIAAIGLVTRRKMRSRD